MAYLLSNISTKNYWNRTTIVEIIVGGWVVSFFETQCSCLIAAHIAWSITSYLEGCVDIGQYVLPVPTFLVACATGIVPVYTRTPVHALHPNSSPNTNPNLNPAEP